MSVLALTLALALGLQGAATPAAPDTAVLRLGNRAIWVFRTSLSEHTPAERAALATDRMVDALRASTLDSIETAPIPDGVVFEIDRRPVFGVLAADVDTAGGDSLSAAIGRVGANLRLAVREYRAAHSWKINLRALIWSLGATIVFIVLLVGLVRSRRWLGSKLEPLTGVAGIGDRRATALLQVSLARLVRVATNLLAWGVGIVFTDVWLTYVLMRFPWTRPWGEALGGYLTQTAASVGLGVLRAIPDLFTLLIVFALARWLTAFVRRIFEGVAAGVISVPAIHAETAIPTRRILTIVIWLIALVFAYPHFPGSGSDAFKGISVFAGLVVSLGSTGIVNQWMSGLAVMYSRAFRKGDFVRIGEAEGTVQGLGWLSTKLLTPLQEEVTIPNAVVISQGTTNYSRLSEDGVLVHTGVTIGYDAPWRQVHAMLLEAARRTAGIRAKPEPYVRQSALSDFYVEYRLVVVVEAAERLTILSHLHANIQDSFNEHGVQILSPHFLGQPAHPVVVPKEKWYAAPARREGTPESS